MSRRVLIADDNETVRHLIRSFLERRSDVEVCAVTANGREAIDAALALRPDLLILDVLMPSLNGIEVASILKKSLPSAKTILFTMYGDYVGKYIASSIGVNIILPKTDGLSSLLYAVTTLLDDSSKGTQSSPGLREKRAEDVGASLVANQTIPDLGTAFRESEERFHATFEQNAVGMGHEAVDGRWLRVNDKLCELLGYSKAQMQQLRFQDLTDPADLPSELAHRERIAAGELENYSFDKRYIGRDGRVVPVQLTLNAVRDARGGLKYFVSVTEESHRQETDQKLAQVTRDLQIANDQLELVSDRLAAPLTRCSRELRYVWVNQRYADWLQRPVDEVIGRRIVDVMGREAFDTLRQRFEQVLTGENVSYQAQANYDKIGLRSISAAYRPTFDATGIPDGWVALVEDITEIREEAKSRSATLAKS